MDRSSSQEWTCPTTSTLIGTVDDTYFFSTELYTANHWQTTGTQTPPPIPWCGFSDMQAGEYINNLSDTTLGPTPPPITYSSGDMDQLQQAVLPWETASVPEEAVFVPPMSTSTPPLQLLDISYCATGTTASHATITNIPFETPGSNNASTNGNVSNSTRAGMRTVTTTAVFTSSTVWTTTATSSFAPYSTTTTMSHGEQDWTDSTLQGLSTAYSTNIILIDELQSNVSFPEWHYEVCMTGQVFWP